MAEIMCMNKESEDDHDFEEMDKPPMCPVYYDYMWEVFVYSSFPL